MTYQTFYSKAKTKIWNTLVSKNKHSRFYPYLYKSYWHYLFNKNTGNRNTTCYYTAMPNPGAGIGHQMANWIAGYWFAKQFNLKFAHSPFSTKEWEEFLGLGINEVKVKDLKKQGYR